MGIGSADSNQTEDREAFRRESARYGVGVTKWAGLNDCIHAKAAAPPSGGRCAW